jgi:hypothetical protein
MEANTRCSDGFLDVLLFNIEHISGKVGKFNPNYPDNPIKERLHSAID